MSKDFEVIEHTADIGIIAYGSDIKEAFANAARGMFSLITDLEDIREASHRDVRAEATDREGLLVDWLNELVFLFDTQNMLFSRFDIMELSDTELKARCYGEKADLSRHDIRIGIKAVTYHMLKVEEIDGFRAQVLFDI